MFVPGGMSAPQYLSPPMSYPIGLTDIEMNIVRSTEPDLSDASSVTSEKPVENDVKSSGDGARKQVMDERVSCGKIAELLIQVNRPTSSGACEFLPNLFQMIEKIKSIYYYGEF